MIGTQQTDVLAKFYENVFEKPADMVEGGWHGWQVGACFFTIGQHSEVDDTAKEPQRLILNFETKEVKKEFERIKAIGAIVIKEPYGEAGSEIATFADPDGNYFQLMSPWEQGK